MGLFGNKEDLVHKLGQLEAKVELLQLQNGELKAEKAQLQERISALQDSLVAIQSPQAYRAIQDDKLAQQWDAQAEKAWKDPVSPNELNAYKEYTRIMEGPTLRTADDLFALLRRSQGVPSPGPLHDPKES